MEVIFIIYTFYGRASTNSENQLSALDNQEQYWLEHFKKKGYELNTNCGAFYSREGKLKTRDGYYIDEGISGYKSKKYRKAFMKMIDDARQKKFDMIYTRSISRFGRNVEDIMTTINQLRKFNVGVYFEDINANTLEKNDEFKIIIFTGLAQEESRLKSSSVQKGKYIAAKKGVWSGREPYGYKVYTGELMVNGVRELVKGILIIDEYEAEVVREIFDLYLNQGYGVSKIAKHLNKKNVPRKRCVSKWCQGTVGKILKNPIYKGIVWQHRTYNIDPQQNIIATVPQGEQILYEDELLRIIDDETFERVQKQKAERYKEFGDFKYKMVRSEDELGNVIEKKVRIGIKRTDQRYSGAHLFSNLLRCGNCGYPLRYKKQKSSSGKIHHYWFCSNNDKMGRCAYRNLQREEVVLTWVKGQIEKFKQEDFLHKGMLNNILRIKFESFDIEKKIIYLENNLEEIKKQADTNLLVFSKEYISEDEFAVRAEKLNEQKIKTEDELSKLKAIDTEKQKTVDQFNEFISSLKQIDTNNLNNIILRNIIDKIIFTTIDKVNQDKNSLIEDHVLPKEIKWKLMDFPLEEIGAQYVEKFFFIKEDEKLNR